MFNASCYFARGYEGIAHRIARQTVRHINGGIALISENAHRGYQFLLAPLPRTRTLLTARRRWRNRLHLRRRASGRAHYNYFRDYDPAIGRYVESDPIGLLAGINTYGYVGANAVSRRDQFGLCDKKICGLKKAPEYDQSGEVFRGTEFNWDAEFLNDERHDPKCCEVRQHIYWNRCWSADECSFFHGFPDLKPGTWYEDRDFADGRYGRRDGRHAFTAPHNRYDGNKYFGNDKPWGPLNEGFYLKFRLVVVDRCRNGKTIYTSKTLRVNF